MEKQQTDDVEQPCHMIIVINVKIGKLGLKSRRYFAAKLRAQLRYSYRWNTFISIHET